MSLLSRLIRYGLVGASGLVVSTVVLEVVWRWLHHWPSAPFAVATEVAIVTNYLLNSRFTFRQPPTWAALARYNLVSVAGGALQVGLATLLVHLGLYHVYAYWLAVPVNTAVGFILSTVWVFRPTSASHAAADAAEPPDTRSVERHR
jgi:dolichol-phosphate mannosyltransferase